MASKSEKALATATIMLVLMAAAVESRITCGVVASKLGSCASYAQNGGQVPAECCTGVKELQQEAATTADRRTACGCIKSLIAIIPGIKPDLMAGIPAKCHVDIGFEISPDMDCSKVK